MNSLTSTPSQSNSISNPHVLFATSQSNSSEIETDMLTSTEDIALSLIESSIHASTNSPTNLAFDEENLRTEAQLSRNESPSKLQHKQFLNLRAWHHNEQTNIQQQLENEEITENESFRYLETAQATYIKIGLLQKQYIKQIAEYGPIAESNFSSISNQINTFTWKLNCANAQLNSTPHNCCITLLSPISNRTNLQLSNCSASLDISLRSSMTQLEEDTSKSALKIMIAAFKEALVALNKELEEVKANHARNVDLNLITLDLKDFHRQLHHIIRHIFRPFALQACESFENTLDVLTAQHSQQIRMCNKRPPTNKMFQPFTAQESQQSHKPTPSSLSSPITPDLSFAQSPSDPSTLANRLALPAYGSHNATVLGQKRSIANHQQSNPLSHNPSPTIIQSNGSIQPLPSSNNCQFTTNNNQSNSNPNITIKPTSIRFQLSTDSPSFQHQHL